MFFNVFFILFYPGTAVPHLESLALVQVFLCVDSYWNFCFWEELSARNSYTIILLTSLLNSLLTYSLTHGLLRAVLVSKYLEFFQISFHSLAHIFLLWWLKNFFCDLNLLKFIQAIEWLMLINVPDPPEKNIYSYVFRCSINVNCLMLLELMSLLTFCLLINYSDNSVNLWICMFVYHFFVVLLVFWNSVFRWKNILNYLPHILKYCFHAL